MRDGWRGTGRREQHEAAMSDIERQVRQFVTENFLMGEEVFAAGTFCSRDPLRLGSLLGQDLCKLAAIIVILLGFVLVAAGSDFLVNLLTI